MASGRFFDVLGRCLSAAQNVAYGRVSRVPPVQTAMRNCTRDEGGPFEIGNQVLVSSHRKLLWSKSHGGEHCGNGGTRSRQARLREASASKPLMTCRKAIRRCQNRGVATPPGLAWGMPETAQAASGMEAARSSTRLWYGTGEPVLRWQGRSHKRLNPRGSEYRCGTQGRSSSY